MLKTWPRRPPAKCCFRITCRGEESPVGLQPMVSIDCFTELPEDLYDRFAALGSDARARGQHVRHSTGVRDLRRADMVALSRLSHGEGSGDNASLGSCSSSFSEARRNCGNPHLVGFPDGVRSAKSMGLRQRVAESPRPEDITGQGMRASAVWLEVPRPEGIASAMGRGRVRVPEDIAGQGTSASVVWLLAGRPLPGLAGGGLQICSAGFSTHISSAVLGPAC